MPAVVEDRSLAKHERQHAARAAPPAPCGCQSPACAAPPHRRARRRCQWPQADRRRRRTRRAAPRRSAGARRSSPRVDPSGIIASMPTLGSTACTIFATAGAAAAGLPLVRTANDRNPIASCSCRCVESPHRCWSASRCRYSTKISGFASRSGDVLRTSSTTPTTSIWEGGPCRHASRRICPTGLAVPKNCRATVRLITIGGTGAVASAA